MTPKNRTFKGKNRRMFPKDKVILLRSSLHFVVGYPFIVLVSNFTKFFLLEGCLIVPAAARRGVPCGGDRIQ